MAPSVVPPVSMVDQKHSCPQRRLAHFHLLRNVGEGHRIRIDAQLAGLADGQEAHTDPCCDGRSKHEPHGIKTGDDIAFQTDFFNPA